MTLDTRPADSPFPAIMSPYTWHVMHIASRAEEADARARPVEDPRARAALRGADMAAFDAEWAADARSAMLDEIANTLRDDA